MNAKTIDGFMLTLTAEGYRFDTCATARARVTARHEAKHWTGPARATAAEAMLDAMEHTLED